MRLRYTDRALSDIDVAIEWYEAQQPGLGMRFLDALESQIKRISNYPLSYQLYYRDFRGCPLSRFPYLVFYTCAEDQIIVHSVFQVRQSPGVRPR